MKACSPTQDLTGQQLIAIGLHVDGVADYLRGNYALAETPFTIGSAARGTICRPECDIDMLAPFSVSDYWKRFESNSRDFLYWARTGLNEHYPRTEVSSKQVAVVIDFTDTVTDVVPTLRRKGGVSSSPMAEGAGGRPTRASTPRSSRMRIEPLAGASLHWSSS